MTRRGNSKHRIGGQFVMRRIDMLRSPAFCVLSLTGRRILDRLEIEHAAHGGRDNGKLPVTFSMTGKCFLPSRAICWICRASSIVAMRCHSLVGGPLAG